MVHGGRHNVNSMLHEKLERVLAFARAQRAERYFRPRVRGVLVGGARANCQIGAKTQNDEPQAQPGERRTGPGCLASLSCLGARAGPRSGSKDQP
eukprot:2147624-Prymnesium_polylepis.1